MGAGPKSGTQPLLFIIGLGVNIPDHTTVEASRCMQACRRIYSIVQESPAIWLPEYVGPKPQVVNVMDMYRDGVLRTDNYERAAKTIIDALTETSPVGYVTYGNPLVYDSVAQSLVRYAVQAEIPFRVVAGLSSIDTLLCDLRVDMAPGLQIYEASWLVAAGIELRTDTAAILLQIGAFGSLLAHYHTLPEPASLSGLVSYLGQFYAHSHRCFLVRSSSMRDRLSNVREVEIGNLCKLLTQDIQNASMYVPAVRAVALDEEAVAKMATQLEVHPENPRLSGPNGIRPQIEAALQVKTKTTS